MVVKKLSKFWFFLIYSVEGFNENRYPAVMLQFSKKEWDDQYFYNCWWTNWYIDAVVPDHDVEKIEDKINITYDNRKTIIPIKKVAPKVQGLSICIRTLYWYVDWVRLIEFVETWRVLGATHFYFYYQTVSLEVYYVLKEYEEMGVVTMIKTEVMPGTQNFDVNNRLYLMGHQAMHNDCLMRTKTQFMALIDTDEIIIPNSNESLLTWLKIQLQLDRFIGSFMFDHAALYYDPTKMTHFYIKKNKFGVKPTYTDWAKINFSWIPTASHSKGIVRASVDLMHYFHFVTDRVNIVLTHYVKFHQWPYKAKNVTKNEAVYYHSRNNYVAINSATINTSSDLTRYFNTRLQSFFNENLRQKIYQNYYKIMQNVEKKLDDKPKLWYKAIDLMDVCLKKWEIYVQKDHFIDGCSPVYLCYNLLHNLTDWVYAKTILGHSDYYIL